jgi:hypothetical protein
MRGQFFRGIGPVGKMGVQVQVGEFRIAHIQAITPLLFPTTNNFSFLFPPPLLTNLIKPFALQHHSHHDRQIGF